MTPPPGKLDFTFSFAADGAGAKARQPPGSGHLVFIAPYSGAAKLSAATSALAPRPLELGETFRIVPSAIPIEPLTPGAKPFLLHFVDTESLHPDALLDTVPSLTELWEPLRHLDSDPSAAGRLAVMVAGPTTVERETDAGAESTGAVERETIGKAGTASTSTEAEGELLDRLLGSRPAQAARTGNFAAEGVSVSAAQALVQQFAARVLSDEATTMRSGGLEISSDLRKKAEAELGRRLRALLRQEAFQRVSGSWLATERVVRSCPDESRARFSTVNAAWTDLVSDLDQFEALLDSGASVVLVDHCFGADGDELSGLVKLLRACHEHRVFLVAGAAPSLAGLEDQFLKNPAGTKHDVEAWQKDWSDEACEAWGQLASLREQGAQFSLALPRCLARHPYGKHGEPLEKFAFEELGERPESVQFLWANGAYLVARALMEQWCGEEAQMDGSYEIGGLPTAVVADVDGRRLQPPIELSLPRAAIDQLLDQGFSIVEARSDSDRARVHV